MQHGAAQHSTAQHSTGSNSWVWVGGGPHSTPVGPPLRFALQGCVVLLVAFGGSHLSDALGVRVAQAQHVQQLAAGGQNGHRSKVGCSAPAVAAMPAGGPCLRVEGGEGSRWLSWRCWVLP
jgi:hypothetical protein